MQPAARRPTVGWLLFSPSGRAGRQVFILGWLFWMTVNCFTVSALATHQDDEQVFGLLSALFFSGVFVSAVSTVMLSIKRLHDMGLPGISVAALFIPAISFVMLFVLCLWPSAKGQNAYGAAADSPQS
ncbi:DUF805 domain-containing protein [Rhizobium sp. CAU 1783]